MNARKGCLWSRFLTIHGSRTLKRNTIWPKCLRWWNLRKRSRNRRRKNRNRKKIKKGWRSLPLRQLLKLRSRGKYRSRCKKRQKDKGKSKQKSKKQPQRQWPQQKLRRRNKIRLSNNKEKENRPWSFSSKNSWLNNNRKSCRKKWRGIRGKKRGVSRKKLRP